MREIDLHDRFSNFLIQQLGYPQSALLREYPLRQSGKVSRYNADLLIQDFDRSRLIAIVEMKRSHSSDIVLRGFEQLARYVEILGRRLPAYLVTGDESAPLGFRIFSQNSERQPIEIHPLNFPSYSALVSGEVTVESERIEKESKEKIDEVKLVCFLAAFVLLALLLLSTSGVFTPSPTHLGLIGAIIALLLLPNTAKLKGLGIEFERLKKEK